MSDLLECHRQDAVLTIRLNRAAKKNAINTAMYLALAGELEAAESDPAVSVILLCGQPDIFSAGNDLADFIDVDDDCMDPVLVFMRALHRAGKPVVAAVRGAAVGIGATLLLHCDLVFASEETRLVYPFVKLGFCPEFGSSRLLVQRIGHLRATQLMLLGDPVSAARAAEWGLVNEVLPDAQVEPAALEAAGRLAAMSVDAVRTSKALLKAANPGLESLFEEEARAFTRLLKTDACQQTLRSMTSGDTRRK